MASIYIYICYCCVTVKKKLNKSLPVHAFKAFFPTILSELEPSSQTRQGIAHRRREKEMLEWIMTFMVLEITAQQFQIVTEILIIFFFIVHYPSKWRPVKLASIIFMVIFLMSPKDINLITIESKRFLIS